MKMAHHKVMLNLCQKIQLFLTTDLQAIRLLKKEIFCHSNLVLQQQPLKAYTSK